MQKYFKSQKKGGTEKTDSLQMKRSMMEVTFNRPFDT